MPEITLAISIDADKFHRRLADDADRQGRPE